LAYWELLWKALFIGGVSIFAVMALWVTVAGFNDIRKLLAGLEKKHAGRKPIGGSSRRRKKR
jgi:hypothetical protein